MHEVVASERGGRGLRLAATDALRVWAVELRILGSHLTVLETAVRKL